MADYKSIFQPFYSTGWENQPSENTPIMGEALDAYDETLVNIEQFLANLDLSGLGGDYALLTEAGYSLNLSLDSNYVLIIDLLNKEGTVLSSKNVDLPLETMFIDAKYSNGIITLTLQNGNTLDVNISDLIRGLVPTTRKIAGVDLTDDITKEELKNALGIYEGTESISTDLEWGIAGFEEDVITATPIGYVIPFDECIDSSNVVFDAENHGFILKAGKTYDLEANIRFISSAGYKYFRFYDNVNKVTRGISGGCEVATSSMYNDAITPAKLIVTPEVDTLYTVIVDTAANTTGSATFIMTSYFKVVELLENIHEGKDITETTSTTLPNSHAGRFKFDKIGGKMEQDSTSGKNLLENTATTRTVNGGTFTVNEDKSIAVNGTFTATTFLRIGGVSLKSNQSYILSGCPSGGTAYNYLISLRDESNGVVYTDDTGSGAEYTPTEDIVAYPLIRIQSGTSMNHTFYPMIRLSSVTDATYEPYTGGQPAPNSSYQMPVKNSKVKGVRTHWKNFLKNNHEKETTNNGLTFIVNDDGTVTINGTATADTNYNIVNSITKSTNTCFKAIQLSGTYSGEILRVAYTSNYAGGVADDIGTIQKLNDKYDYLRFRITVKNGTICNNLVVGFMVSTEEYVNTYEPYTESSIAFSQPIELYGKDGVQDVIESGEIKGRFRKLVLDSSNLNGWTASSSVVGRYVYYNEEMKIGGLSLCSQAVSDIGATTEVNRCYLSELAPQFVINTEFSTLSEWKSHLTEKPVEVVFELAEEVVEDLPIADQIALNSLATYDGITYMEFIYEGLEPTFKGEYGTSKVGGYTLESLLTARNNDLKITAVESAVVNNL